MIRLSALALAAGLVVSGASLAQADSAVTGKWTYQVGTTGTPCALTFTANTSDSSGDVAAAGDCASGLSAVGHWRTVGSRLQLISPAGNLVAILRPQGDGYAGQQIEGGRKIALSR